MYEPLKKISLLPSLRRLIDWRRIKIWAKDKLTLYPTQQLNLETYLIKWKNPAETMRNQRHLDLFNFNPQANLNIRFRSNLNAAKLRFARLHGKITKHQKGRAHSYLLNWLTMVERELNGAITSPISMTDTSNTSRTVYPCGYSSTPYWMITAPATNTSYGILCGTSTAAITETDYKINTLIANGSSSGQLNYGATYIFQAQPAGNYTQIMIARSVTNNSGATITVNEIGIALVYNSGTYYFLVVHDLVTQAITTGSTYLIIYTMQTSISS
jgi:hypothetical protein